MTRRAMRTGRHAVPDYRTRWTATGADRKGEPTVHCYHLERLHELRELELAHRHERLARLREASPCESTPRERLAAALIALALRLAPTLRESRTTGLGAPARP